MGDHLLGCIDALETRCSNQFHHWTHELVSRASSANAIELKRGGREGILSLDNYGETQEKG